MRAYTFFTPSRKEVTAVTTIATITSMNSMSPGLNRWPSLSGLSLYLNKVFRVAQFNAQCHALQASHIQKPYSPSFGGWKQRESSAWSAHATLLSHTTKLQNEEEGLKKFRFKSLPK